VSNRIWQYFPRSPDPPAREEYFVIEIRDESIPVLAFVARRVMAELQEPEAPFWITFRDVLGATHHVRADDIHIVRESSPRIRARMRAFWRARKREADEDESSCED
jgi:hypothetical protein